MIFVIFAFCILKVFGNNNDLIDASKWAVEGSWPPPEANIDNDIISRLIELRSGFEKVLLVQNSTSQVKTPENTSTTATQSSQETTQAQPVLRYHQVHVIIAVDDSYKLTLNGIRINTEDNYVTRTIDTLNFLAFGNGPWVIGVEAIDTGVVAGLIGAVYIDGVLKIGTGVSGLQTFKSSLNPAPGWNQYVAFDDSEWENPVVCNDRLEVWGSQISGFNNAAKNTYQPIWHKSCDNTKVSSYFRAILST